MASQQRQSPIGWDTSPERAINEMLRRERRRAKARGRAVRMARARTFRLGTPSRIGKLLAAAAAFVVGLAGAAVLAGWGLR